MSNNKKNHMVKKQKQIKAGKGNNSIGSNV